MPSSMPFYHCKKNNKTSSNIFRIIHSHSQHEDLLINKLIFYIVSHPFLPYRCTARRDEEISVEFVVDKSSDEEDTTPPTLYKHTDKGSYNTLRLLAEQRRSSPVHFS